MSGRSRSRLLSAGKRSTSSCRRSRSVALSVEISDGVGSTIVTRKGPAGRTLVVRGFVPRRAAGRAAVSLRDGEGRSSFEPRDRVPAAGRRQGDPARRGGRGPTTRPRPRCGCPPIARACTRTGAPGTSTCSRSSRGRRADARRLDRYPERSRSRDRSPGRWQARHQGRSPRQGAAERVTAPVPAGAHAVIRVHGADTAGEGAYELVINEGAAPP